MAQQRSGLQQTGLRQGPGARANKMTAESVLVQAPGTPAGQRAGPCPLLVGSPSPTGRTWSPGHCRPVTPRPTLRGQDLLAGAGGWRVVPGAFLEEGAGDSGLTWPPLPQRGASPSLPQALVSGRAGWGPSGGSRPCSHRWAPLFSHQGWTEAAALELPQGPALVCVVPVTPRPGPTAWSILYLHRAWQRWAKSEQSSPTHRV